MPTRSVSSEPVIFCSLVHILGAFARTRGLDITPHLARHKITPELLSNPDARVPYHILLDVWDELLAREPDVALGIAYGKMIDIEQAGLIGLVIMHSPTLRASIQQCIRFQALLDPFFEMTLEVRGEQARLLLNHEPRVLAMREPIEMMLLSMVSNVWRSGLGDASPTRVTFQHSRRHELALYNEAFSAPVEFDAESNSIEFDAGLLDRSFPHVTPAVQKYLEPQLEELADELERSSWTIRAQRIVSSRLDEPGLQQADVARALSVTSRTLQRRLKEEETTFSALVDRTRSQRAHQLLTSTNVTSCEVAFLLGYSDTTAFYRAFKRWFDCTPEQLRREGT